jgi:hypothetical protein
MAIAARSIQSQGDPRATEVWEPVPGEIEPENVGEAPSDAIVLFDGTDLSEWRGEEGTAPWKVEGGVFTVAPGTGDISTRTVFGDVQLHLEWRSPARVVGEGQGRGNSGVFLMGLYEVQILDSHQKASTSSSCRW